jgi:hypothetical protein
MSNANTCDHDKDYDFEQRCLLLQLTPIKKAAFIVLIKAARFVFRGNSSLPPRR